MSRRVPTRMSGVAARLLPGVLTVALALACTAAPTSTPPRAGALDTLPAAQAAGPAGAAATSIAPDAAAPPEKSALNIGAVLTGSAYLPLVVANEAGYFQAHGLTVEVSALAASAAAQALVAGSVDMYLGGATAIAAHLAGNDIIYVGAAVDKSSLMLIGEPGTASFPDFRA